MDFRTYNLQIAKNLALYLHNQSQARQEVDNRIAEAKVRREQSTEGRVDKLKFEMLKWELYRLRVDSIEDDYADFKRLQKKINQWLFITLRHLAVHKVLHRFKEHKAAVALCLEREQKHGRICRGLRRYLQRKGASPQTRAHRWIRGSVTFNQLALLPGAKHGSRVFIHKFLRDAADDFYMRKRFARLREHVVTIQQAIQKARLVRLLRIRVLDGFFEKELATMLKHYQERAKKAKKLRPLLASL